MNDIALCVSLCTYINDREHLACRKHFINVMSSGKYLESFWTLKHFGNFSDNIFG